MSIEVPCDCCGHNQNLPGALLQFISPPNTAKRCDTLKLHVCRRCMALVRDELEVWLRNLTKGRMG